MTKSASLLVLVAYSMAISGTAESVKEPILKALPAEILYRIGHPLQLKCGTVTDIDGTVEESTQNIEYTWNKNGTSLDLKLAHNVTQNEKDGTITFEDPTEETEGIYQCFAKTSYGTASTREVHVRRTFIDNPKILRQKHQPETGKVYKLDCKLPSGYPVPTIEWVRNLSEGKTELVLDLRITTGPDGVLYFSNVTSEDAGQDKYVCRARSPAAEKPVVLAKHVIERVVPGNANDNELVPQYLSHDVVAKAGDVTRFCCIYGGTPIAHPDWFYGDKNVNNQPEDRITRYNRSAGKCLLIKETYRSDQGTYTCKVNNNVGKPQEHSINLTVVSSPEFLNKPQPILKVEEGQEVTIPCQVTGVDASRVTWTYNAKPLEVNDRATLEENNNLVIKNVLNSDTGYYGCKVENSHGAIYAETLLIVIQ